MKRITSIGEILFDIYPKGKKLGGAPFNFIYHIIKLTGKGNFISRIGNDDQGKDILDYLKKENISTEYIQTDEIHKTGAAKTNLSKDKIPGFVIEKDSAYDFIEKSSAVDDLIENKTDCLYFGTLAQRNEKSRSTIQSLFNNRVQKYFCDLNIRQDFYSKSVIEKSLTAADVLKLNEEELKLINDLLLGSEYSLHNSAKRIAEAFSIEMLCITMGSGGAFLFRGREENFFQSKNDVVEDTVGAGDAFASILCIGFLNNWKINKINRLATEFANEIVKIEGALPRDDKIYDTYRKKLNHENK